MLLLGPITGVSITPVDVRNRWTLNKNPRKFFINPYQKLLRDILVDAQLIMKHIAVLMR